METTPALGPTDEQLKRAKARIVAPSGPDEGATTAQARLIGDSGKKPPYSTFRETTPLSVCGSSNDAFFDTQPESESKLIGVHSHALRRCIYLPGIKGKHRLFGRSMKRSSVPIEIRK